MKLEDFGWSCCEYQQLPDQTYGRVALANRQRFLVWTAKGEIEASISGHLRHTNHDYPCVGDWVTLRDESVITSVLPRHTALVRKEPGSAIRQQVLAANIEVLFIVTGLDQDYSSRRLERYLVLAYESGARPVIILNKADLRMDLTDVMQETEQCAPGVSVLGISALTGQGVDTVCEQMKQGETAALIGSSGAGKSTLLNCLLGTERQVTGGVREFDSKGRHTTTRRELFLMPQGWLLMDLPGLRELQLWADPEQIDNAFSEIAELAAECRFRDCTHGEEPGCAVREAGVSPERLASYHKLQREVHFLEKQTDRESARAYKKFCKVTERAVRSHPKRKF